MSLSDEEATDAKKEFDDIDNKFDEARVANSKLNPKSWTYWDLHWTSRSETIKVEKDMTVIVLGL